MMRQILETVEQLHQSGIFHFDLKPENILATSQKFKIIDFGSAQMLERTRVYPHDAMFPELEYLSYACETTEQFSSSRYD